VNILELIDQLDELVHRAKPIPLSKQVRVDRDEVNAILDRLRATLPEAIKKGSPIVDDAFVADLDHAERRR
jgi:hypothetical protein